MSASDAQSDDGVQYHTIDETEARKLHSTQPNPSEVRELEQKIKSCGNTNRLRILQYLSQQDLCVHDLSALLDMSQSAVSHQLKELHNQDLLSRRKEGRVVYYSLNKNTFQEILNNLEGLLTT